MAKFKKKQSEPTPGSNDSQSKIMDKIDIPETEKSEPIVNNSKEPSKDPQIIDVAKSEKDKKELDLGHCGSCRACWKPTIKNIEYGIH